MCAKRLDVRLSAVKHDHLFQLVDGGTIWRRDCNGDDGPLLGLRLHDLNLDGAEPMTEAGRVLHQMLDTPVTPLD